MGPLPLVSPMHVTQVRHKAKCPLIALLSTLTMGFGEIFIILLYKYFLLCRGGGYQ